MANRCLYIATFKKFLEQKPLEVLGTLHNNYHGEALTTTDEAWMGEIDILQQVLQPWKDEGAQVIFEYEIPRMGKRVDVVLLLRGIIFCLSVLMWYCYYEELSSVLNSKLDNEMLYRQM